MREVKSPCFETVFPLGNGIVQVTRIPEYCANCKLYTEHKDIVTQGDITRYYIYCEHIHACNYAINATVSNLIDKTADQYEKLKIVKEEKKNGDHVSSNGTKNP